MLPAPLLRGAAAPLLKRLDKPRKRWKFSPGDAADRSLWPAHQEAYTPALELCSTPSARWYLIPADHKWYRNQAVGRLLLDHLTAPDPRCPKTDLDVARYRALLLGDRGLRPCGPGDHTGTLNPAGRGTRRP